MKKALSLTLALLMLLLTLSTAGAETVKHERVFAVLAPDGTVQSLTDSIRLENGDHLDTLTDRTRLTNIQNVSGHETFTLDGETLTWQAKGNDITWQGTSSEALPVTPVVTITLDGQTVTAEELAKGKGAAEITVAYQTPTGVPHLAASLLMLPEEGVSNITLDNAMLLSLSGTQAVVGWAIPGADGDLGLPDAFTISFDADHAALTWMMTAATADPIEAVCREVDDRIDLDVHAELDDLVALLTALQAGETLPETTGETKEIAEKINTLNDGLIQLDDGAQTLAEGTVTLRDGANALATGTDLLADGAQTLADGTVTLADGATTLSDGLGTLKENSTALVEGAQAIFAAILSTANEQLAAAGLAEAGIDLPELTADNWQEALESAIAQLDPDTLSASAHDQVEAAVREQVEANEDQIREAVSQVVQDKVLDEVLKALGQNYDAESWKAAVESGEIHAAIAKLVDAALNRQLESAEVQEALENAVQEQKETLVAEKTEEYLATDETIAAKLAQAAAGRESLVSLSEQLAQIQTFVDGVTAYTDGANQAADGAAALADGAVTLRDGAQTLADGVTELQSGAWTLYDGTVELADGAATLQQDGTAEIRSQLLTAEQEAAEKLLPLVDTDVRDAIAIYERTRDAAADAGYDLRPEGMTTVTVYVMRTDMK